MSTKAIINGKNYKGSFGLEIDQIKIDSETSIHGRRSVTGYILINDKTNEFKKNYMNGYKIIIQSSLIISSIDVDFMGHFYPAEYRENIHPESGEVIDAMNVMSDGNVYFDFSGIDYKSQVHLLNILYGEE